MAQYSWIVLSVMLTSCMLEVSSRPSDSESTILPRYDIPSDTTEEISDEELPQEQVRYPEIDNDNTQEILEKINAINEGLIKPNRNRIKNSQMHTGPSYVLDPSTLEKIQQLISGGKLNAYSDVQKKQEDNYLRNENNEYRYDNSRAMQYGAFPSDLMASNQVKSAASVGQSPSVPYITSIPVLVMPTPSNELYDRYPQNSFNSLESDSQFQTRQRPPVSLPFNINWPLAPFFPILVKDPLLGFLHGGGWNNFVEYGQSADVCNRKQKAMEGDTKETIEKEVPEENETQIANLFPEVKTNAREARAIRKRTVSTVAPKKKTLDNSKKSKKFFTQKPTEAPVTKPKPIQSGTNQNTKTVPKDDDLRFHMGGFSLFGSRPSVTPYNPGFFINKLKVRRGGVAIAGPGGVATAGKGGAAIVGPGGLAYTQPGGLAVAGPSSRVIALTSDVDLSTIVTRLQQQQAATDGSVPRLLEAIPEGKIVAIGPTIYYHPETVQYLPFYGGGKGQYLEVKTNNRGVVISEAIVSEEKISSENVVKNVDESLLSKVLAKNLRNLQTLSSGLIKLHNLGRRTGVLANADKEQFRTQLNSLGEAASNTIKLIEEVGGNVDILFKSGSKRQYENDEEDVGEEGVGIDSPSGEEGIPLDGITIAEAKPVGLAVIGEHGLAASRPQATAIAVSGVALARPIATAIAGINPAQLGIEFHVNNKGQ